MKLIFFIAAAFAVLFSSCVPFMEPAYASLNYVVCNHSLDTIKLAVMAHHINDKNEKLLCYQKIESDILPSDSSTCFFQYEGESMHGLKCYCSDFFINKKVDTLYFIIFKNDIDIVDNKKSALPTGPNVLRIDKYYEGYIDLDVEYLKIVYP